MAARPRIPLDRSLLAMICPSTTATSRARNALDKLKDTSIHKSYTTRWGMTCLGLRISTSFRYQRKAADPRPAYLCNDLLHRIHVVLERRVVRLPCVGCPHRRHLRPRLPRHGLGRLGVHVLCQAVDNVNHGGRRCTSGDMVRGR